MVAEAKPIEEAFDHPVIEVGYINGVRYRRHFGPPLPNLLTPRQLEPLFELAYRRIRREELDLGVEGPKT